MLKKHIYNNIENEKSFIHQKLINDSKNNDDDQYQFINNDNNGNKNLIFMASYFGHTNIVNEIIENNKSQALTTEHKFGKLFKTSLIIGKYKMNL